MTFNPAELTPVAEQGMIPRGEWPAQLAKFIRRRRETMGLSQSAVAMKMTSIMGERKNQWRVSALEIGKYAPEIPELIALSEALEFSIAEVFHKLERGEPLTDHTPRLLRAPDGTTYQLVETPAEEPAGLDPFFDAVTDFTRKDNTND